MSKVVPEDVHLAAKRGFIRTTYQAYATSLSGATISVGAIVAILENPDPLLILAAVVAAILTPLLAGLASYLSITANGIPKDYAAAAEVDATPVPPDYKPRH